MTIGTVNGSESAQAVYGGTVLVVGPLPPPYMGPAVGTVMVREAFEAGGARTVHLNTQDDRSSADFVEQVGRFDLRNVWLGLLHAAQMFSRSLRHSVDVVYIPISQNRLGYLRDALLMGIARLLRRRLIIHLRGSEMHDFMGSITPVERRLVRWTMRWATMAVVLTPGLRPQFSGLVDPERIVVLENAIPDPFPEGIDELAAARADRLSERPRALRLLFISNQLEAKGGNTLIAAIARPGLEEVELRIMGAPAGRDLQASVELAEQLGVTDRVRMLGAMGGARKEAELAAADVLAHPSGRDGQPIVLIEGMAAGLPLIGSTIGGVPETIGDCGPIVEPGDVDGLAAALRRLVEEADHRAELGRRSRRRFEEIYSTTPYRERFHSVVGGLMPPPG